MNRLWSSYRNGLIIPVLSRIAPTTLLLSKRNVLTGSKILFYSLKDILSGGRKFYHVHKSFLGHPEKQFCTCRDFRRIPKKVFQRAGNVLHPSKILFCPVADLSPTIRKIFVSGKNVLLLKIKVVFSIRSFIAVQKRVFGPIRAFFRILVPFNSLNPTKPGVQPFVQCRHLWRWLGCGMDDCRDGLCPFIIFLLQKSVHLSGIEKGDTCCNQQS